MTKRLAIIGYLDHGKTSLASALTAVFAEQDAADLKWAKEYCAERGLTYLSHETYRTMKSHQICIAVEDHSGRYELKLDRLNAR